MLVFDLIINGKLVATAGAEDLCVITGHLTAVGKLGATSLGAQVRRKGIEIKCELGGMTARNIEPTNVHLHWSNTILKVGDEVMFRVRESLTADPPSDG